MPDLGSSGLPLAEFAENPEIRPYVDGLRRKTLVLPCCRKCDFVIWFPRVLCPRCGTMSVEWTEVEARGRVYSYTIIHRTTGAFTGSVPFVLAYVELYSGPRILANIVGRVDGLAIGSEVIAHYAGGEATPTMQFRLVNATPREE
jgi:hypothetical protein